MLAIAGSYSLRDLNLHVKSRGAASQERPTRRFVKIVRLQNRHVCSLNKKRSPIPGRESSRGSTQICSFIILEHLLEPLTRARRFSYLLSACCYQHIAFRLPLTGGFRQVHLGETLSRWSPFAVRCGAGYSSRSTRFDIRI